MKTLIRNTIILSNLLLGLTKLPAQGSLSAHIGPAFPTADYGDDDAFDDDAGGASIGISAGVLSLYPLSQEGLSLYGSAHLNLHGIKKAYREDIEDLVGNNADIKFAKHFNLPLSAGLHYAFDLGKNLPVFSNLDLALNFLKITNTVIEGANNSETTFTYDLASNVGVRIGGGVMIEENISVELNFYGLGSHDILNLFYHSSY